MLLACIHAFLSTSFSAGKVRITCCVDGHFFLSLKDINKYSTFSMLPRDISQQIFDDLVCSQCLSDYILEAFRDCALQVPLTLFKSLMWSRYLDWYKFNEESVIVLCRILIWENTQDLMTVGWMSSLHRVHLYYPWIFRVLMLLILD